MKKFLLATLRIVSFSLVVSCAILALAQDAILFPRAWRFFSDVPDNMESLNPNLSKFTVQTTDGKELEVWRLPAVGKVIGASVVFRGNDGPLDLVYPLQKWASDQGLNAYLFNYRGYGKSTGMPSESGILIDGRAVIDNVLARENIDHEKLVLVGVSLGSGPAAIMSAEYKAAAVLLVAGYSSLKRAARENKFFKYLSLFLRTEFNAEEAISRLDQTCLYILHGIADPLFAFDSHGKRNLEAYKGSGFKTLLRDDSGSHVVNLQLVNNFSLSSCDAFK